MMILLLRNYKNSSKKARRKWLYFPEDTVWQGKGEAFPYVETPSQLKAIEDVKKRYGI